MEVLGLSLVTNLAAGICAKDVCSPNREGVLIAGERAASRMGTLLASIVPRI